MQHADPVGLGTGADGERREVEQVVGAGPGASQLEDRLHGNAEVGRQRRHVLPHQAGVEDLVAGRHRRMRRENRVPRDATAGLGEGDPVAPHALPDPLQRQERGVPLVHVPDRGLEAQGAQRDHSTHAQHQLLAQAHLAAAHVEEGGDGAIGGVVLAHVGVEEDHGQAAHGGFPEAQPDHAAGQVELHPDLAATGPGDRLHGQALQVVKQAGVPVDSALIRNLTAAVLKNRRISGTSETRRAQGRLAQRMERVANGLGVNVYRPKATAKVKLRRGTGGKGATGGK